MRSVFYVEKFVIEHKIDKLARFLAHIVIHFTRFCDKKIVIADGLCVSVAENKFFVVRFKVADAYTFSLRLVEFFTERNEFVFYLLAERRNVLFVIIGSSLL